MKTRSKLLLAAVSLLTVSVAATATSAYAWYTANRQVQASVTQMGVSSTTGSLTIARPKDAVDSFSLTGQETQSNPAYNTPADKTPNYTGSLTGVALTDVSSKGLGDFAKPKFDASGKNIVDNYTINPPAAPNAGKTNRGGETVTIANGVSVYGVVTMEFEIQNKTENTSADDLNVYIKNASFTSGTPENSNKANVINAARFSIIDLENPDEDKPYLYCNPTGTETLKYYDSNAKKEKYLSNGTDVKKASDTDSEEVKAEATQVAQKAQEDQDGVNCDWIQDKTTEKKLFDPKHKDVTSPSKANNVKSNGFLCTISAKASHRFLLTMWIEGTDPECTLSSGDDTDITLETNLSLNISLYALNSTPNPTTTPSQGEGGAA